MGLYGSGWSLHDKVIHGRGGMGDWFKQIFIQGLIIGVLASLLIYLPWGWAKIVLFVLLLYLALMMGRNPLFFYRQLIRGLALISVFTLGVSGRFTGNLVLPQGLGVIDYFIELGGNAPVVVMIALAIFVAADFGFALLQERVNRKLVGAITIDVPVGSASGNSASVSREFTLTGQKERIVLTGARIEIGPFGKPEWNTDLAKLDGDDVEDRITETNRAAVDPGQALTLMVDATSRPGEWGKLLVLRLSRLARFVFPVRGRLDLLRGTEPPITIPLRLVR